MIDRTTYSQLLRKLRKCYGMKQEEVANLLCLSRQAYSTYEIGRGTLNVEDLEKLAEHYGFTFIEFLNLAYTLQNASEYPDLALDTGAGLLREETTAYAHALPSHASYLLDQRDESLLQTYNSLPEEAKDLLYKLIRILLRPGEEEQ